MAERPRTALAGIVLVNWKGVFLQDYRLNQTITALEGVNGAGKTTVMVAAFVAMFPDQRWLDFENVAVSGKQRDRGIVGRLGKPGPSWAVLDIQTSRGGRCLAGVHLRRGAERQVELEPFVVHEVPAQADVHELLLIQVEAGQVQVPDPVELDRHLGRKALSVKRLEPQRYFEELFELGVLSAPLRAAAERQRFFELLQTSLMGGLSDKVRRGLREYLLHEDNSVAGAVKRMQDNLLACRTTRDQLERFDGIQSRISEVHSSGQEMFSLGVHATRRRAEELEHKASAAKETLTQRKVEAERTRTERDELFARRSEAERARTEANEASQRAATRARHVEEAHRVEQERDEAQARLNEAEVGWALAKERVAADCALEVAAAAEESGARHALSEIASRKAQQAQAWEEVSRKVGRYRQALGAVAEARKMDGGLLAAEPGEVARGLPAARAEVGRRLTEARAGARALAQELADATQRAEAWGRAQAALARLLEGPAPDADAFTSAQAALARLDDWERELAQLPQLQRELRDLEDRLRRRQAVVKAAAAVTHPLGALRGAADVRLALKHDVDAQAEAVRQREETDRLRRDAAIAVETSTPRCRQLEVDAQRWRAVHEEAQALGLPVRSGAVAEALNSLDGETERCAETLRDLRAERSRLEQERVELETAGRARDPRLDAVAMRVGGRVLLELLDDTPLKDAALVEARLGPDIDGVVVDDPQAAALVVANLDDAPPQVVLLPTKKLVNPLTVTPHAVIVQDYEGFRVTRLPSSPLVGAAARLGRIDTLRERIAALDMLESERLTEQEALRARRRRIQALQPEASWLDREDPQPTHARELALLTRSRATAAGMASALSALDNELRTLRERKAKIEALLPDAALLDQPELEEDAAQTRERIDTLKGRQARLSAVAAARVSLRQGLDALRTPPPSAEERAAQQVTLEARRADEARLDALDAALRVIDPEALGWADQEEVLAGREGILRSLDAEENVAKGRLDVVTKALESARAAYSQSRAQEASASGARSSARRELARHQQRLDQLAVADASAEAVTAAKEAATRAHRDAVSADRLHTQAVAAAAQAESKLASAEQEERDAQAEADRTRGEAEPWSARWQELREAVAAAGLLASLTGTTADADREGGVNLSKRATEVRRRLVLALKNAGEAQTLLDAVERGAESDESAGHRYLDLWREVRRWVLERVPREVSESDDPSAALASLAQRIHSLRQTLARDEKRLRTDAGEIARSINTRFGREQRRMSRLNQDLAGAGFGSIEGMRVKLSWRDHMRRLVESLQDQRTLFRTDLPLDEAMAELYRAQGGGKVKGQQLLDYREYLDIDLEIRRRGEERWRSSRDQGVSTGEAIGVGAAVLMVVLSAWEEDYRQARTSQGVRPLRFLFLDEASRLSPDSLTVLFDLCRRMEIQMLVAAPHVPSEAGAVIYRLVRGIDEAGQEVVTATGRRFTART